MSKRLVAFLLILSILLTSFAYAEEEVQLTSIVTFELDYWEVPGYDPQGRKIVAIGENAFAGQKHLRALALPSTIRSIGDRAFIECKGLNGILIPETVVEFGSDLFHEDGKWVTIIAPAGSAAILYAQENGIRYVELEQRTLAEADERYLGLLMFKLAGNSNYFSTKADTDAYFLTMNFSDTVNMGLTDYLSLAWNSVMDFFRGDGKNSYTAEQYMNQMGSILEEMQGIAAIHVDTSLLQGLTSLAASGADSYKDLVEWLLGSEFLDDPFVKSVIENGEKLEYLSTALGGFDKVMSILIYACRDYSTSIAVLDSLISLSTEYTDPGFYDAMVTLKQLYEGNVNGMLGSLLSEFYVDIGKVLTDGVIAAISADALLLYNVINFSIDFALSASGIKEEADNQRDYIMLMNMSDECEEIFSIIMNGTDNTPETMMHLDVLIQLCRAIRLRLYDVQISLFNYKGDTETADELGWSKAYFAQRVDIIASYTPSLSPRMSESDDLMTTIPVTATAIQPSSGLNSTETNAIRRYADFMNSSPTSYTHAVICDFDFDGVPEVIAQYYSGRWGQDCHVLDIVNDTILVSELNEMTFGGWYDAGIDLICLPDGEICWIAVYALAAQGQLIEGMWKLHYNADSGVEKEAWFYRDHWDADTQRAGERYYVNGQEVPLSVRNQEVVRCESADRLVVLPIAEMEYPIHWDEAVDAYISSRGVYAEIVGAQSETAAETNFDNLLTYAVDARSIAQRVNALCGKEYMSITEAYVEDGYYGYNGTIGAGMTGVFVVGGWGDPADGSWQLDYARIETRADILSNEEEVASLYANLLHVLCGVDYSIMRSTLLDIMYYTDFSPVGDWGLDRYVEVPCNGVDGLGIDISLTDDGTVWTMSFGIEYEDRWP